jgi:hypothetical protein
MRRLIWCVAAWAAAATPAGASGAEHADLILHGGKIITVDARDTIAQAMAVRGQVIAAVGDEAEVMKLRGPATRVIDLKGRCVTPGLMDSHVHAPGASMTEFDHPIPDMATIDDVLAYIRGRAAVVPQEGWITLEQVFITRLAEQRYPTRAELDEAAPRHAVVFRTGPDASLNSRALKETGIDRNKQAPPGSKIEKDAAGEPTGILRGWAKLIQVPRQASKPATPADQETRLKELLSDYNAVGLTSVADRSASPGSVQLYQRLLDRGELTVRVALSRGIGNTGSAQDIIQQIDQIAAEPLRRGGPMLRIVGVKMFLDGGMLTGSAYMREPWGVSRIYAIDDPTYRGIRFVEQDKLDAVVLAALRHGLQFTAHSVGDAAVHALIDAYEHASLALDIRPARPCVTHCNFMSRESIDRMARLGICADIQPAWLALDGKTLTAHFGYDRMRWFQPLRSCFEAGTVVGGGSDHMQKIGPLRSINFYNPWLALWTAIARKPRGVDQPLHPQESLTRLQALRYYTMNNAWILFQETTTGSLEPGKQADFIVLDRDYLDCPLDDIATIAVDLTYLSGKPVHQRR